MLSSLTIRPCSCCPANNYCAWSNSQVACCPNGETCSGWAGGGGGYSPTSWTTYWQPTTTEWQPTTTVWQPTTYVATTTVEGGGAVVPAGNQNTEPNYGNGQYCSTLVEEGPNLPTTAPGSCGTILIVEPSEAIRQVVGLTKILALVIGLQALGGMTLFRR